MSEALRSVLLDWWRPGSSAVPRVLCGAASLAFLAYPAADLLTGRLGGPTAIAAALGLTSFCLLYLRVFAILPAATDARRVEALAALGALAALALALAIGIGGASGARDSWEGPFVYVAAAAALALPIRIAPAAVVGVAAAVFALGGGIGSLALETLFIGLLLVTVGGLKALIDERDAAREQVAELAVSEERLRMSRELHDLLGHSLSVIALKSELARKLIDRDPEAAAREASDIEAVARDSLQEARDAVHELRRASLAAELDRAREALEAAGIEVAIRTSGSLPGRVEAALAAAVREATTNVIRHSGARSCELVVGRGEGVAELAVSDDGAGPQRGRGDGSGLRGLGERMAETGGTLDAGPVRGGGFRLIARVPLAKERPARPDPEGEFVTWTEPVNVVPPLRPLPFDQLGRAAATRGSGERRDDAEEAPGEGR